MTYTDNAKLKILITTDWYDYAINGVVISVLNLKKELVNKGHEVKILTLSTDCHTRINHDVYQMASISISKVYPNSRLRIHTKKRITKELLDWKPDIVHSQCEFSTFPLAIHIAQTLGIPLVHTYHTVYEDYTHYFFPSKRGGRRIAQGLTRYFLKKTDHVVAPSKKVKGLLSDYKIDKPISVIPTGIDTGSFSHLPESSWIEGTKKACGIKPDELVLLFVGRLAKEKNVEELLSFMSDKRALGLKLLIVGDGPHRANLERYCTHLGVWDRVRFTGMVKSEDVGAYYHLGDIFVNSSTSETQGLTYAEALSSGLPMLCRRDEVLENVIEDGKNGWKYKNSMEFFNAIESVRDDRDRLLKMGKASLEKSSEFSLKTFADRAESLYFSCIQNNPPKSQD